MKGNWDEQLCKLIKYCFFLKFNPVKPLYHEYKNHSSAKLFAKHVKAYIEEEKHYGTIYSPYKAPPFDHTEGLLWILATPWVFCQFWCTFG